MAFCCINYISGDFATPRLSPKFQNNTIKSSNRSLQGQPPKFLDAKRNLGYDSTFSKKQNESRDDHRVEKERRVEVRTIVDGRTTRKAHSPLAKAKHVNRTEIYIGNCDGRTQGKSKNQDDIKPDYSSESPFSQSYEIQPSPDLARKKSTWMNEYGSVIPKRPEICDDGKERLFKDKLYPKQMEYKKPSSQGNAYTASQYAEEQEIWNASVEELLAMDPSGMSAGVLRQYEYRYAWYQYNLEKQNKHEEFEKRRQEKKQEKKQKRQEKRETRKEFKRRVVKTTSKYFWRIAWGSAAVLAFVFYPPALFHRLVKEFDSERIVTSDEEPKTKGEATKKRVPSNGSDVDVNTEENKDAPFVEKRKANAQKNDVPVEADHSESSRPKNDQTSKDTTELESRAGSVSNNDQPEPSKNESIHSSSTPSQNESKTSGAYSNTNDQTIPKASLDETSHSTPDKPSDEILKSLDDGNWLYAECIDYYMDVLHERYSAEAAQKSISYIRLPVVAKYPGTTGWTFSPDLYLQSCLTEGSRKFGYIGNGEHYICYLFDSNTLQLRVYGVDGLPFYEQDMREGVKALKEGLEKINLTGEINIDYVESSIRQQDGNNCGVSCLLEFEKLLTGRIPEGVHSLQHYRQKIREDVGRVYHDYYPNTPTSNNLEENSKLQPIEESGPEINALPSYPKCLNQCQGHYFNQLNAIESNNSSKHMPHQPSTCSPFSNSNSMVDLGPSRTKHSDSYTNHEQLNQQGEKNRRKQGILFRNESIYDNPIEECLAQPLKRNNSEPSLINSRIDSVDKLLDLYPTLDVMDDQGLVCKTCKSTGTNKAVLHYKMSVGTDFSNCKRIPKEFHNLVQKIRVHLATPMHERNMAEKNPEDMTIRQDPETAQAALNLTRIAYHTIKERQSYNSFTRKLALDTKLKVNAGDINHSPSFMAKVVDACHECLHDRIKYVLNEPLPSTGRCRPFSVVADKCTPNKDTIHIIGIVFLDDGQLKAFVLKADPLVGVTAQDLANSIINVLRRYVDDEAIRTRCTGFAFDGQYFQLGVDKKLTEILNITEENRKWYSFIHDPAHVIELAGKNARKQESKTLKIGVRWLREFLSVITHGVYQCGWGKTWGIIREMVKEMIESMEEGEEKARLKRFKRWCDTRFTTYACEVLEAFRHNFRFVYEEFMKTNDRYSKVIQQASFSMQLCALLDVYNAISVTSKAVQTVRMTPWHVEDQLDLLQKTLNDMKSEILAKVNSEVGNENQILAGWPKLQDCLEQITTNQSYAACPLQNKIYKSYSTRSLPEETCSHVRCPLQKVADQISEHITDFVKSLETRLDRGTQHMHGIIRECFSIEAIAERGNNSPPLQFQELVTRSRDAGYLRAAATDEIMRGQYNMFANYVREVLPITGYPVFAINPQEEVAFYSELISGIQSDDRPRQQFADILHLVASSITRTSCESVTESMGSVLKNILQGREALSLEHQDAELFISWNGPTPTEPDTDNLLFDVNDLMYGGRWHANRTSEKRKLKSYEVSKSVDAETKKRGRLSYPKKHIRNFRKTGEQ